MTPPDHATAVHSTALARLPLFRRPARLGTLAALAILAPAAWCSGTRVGFKDAFAMARGNAFVATADNPSAVFYNTAGLARMDGLRASGNLYEVSVSSHYSGPGGTTSLDEDYHTIPSFYIAYNPTSDPWACGFGVYAPFGLSTEWPDPSPLRTLSLKAEQKCVTYNISGAWEFSPSLSVGAAVTYNRVDTDISRALGFLAANDLLRFQGDGHAWGFNLGFLWQPAPQHSLGISYSHRFSVSADGTTDTIPLVTGEASSARWEFPEVVVAGWSWRPTSDWNAEFDITWTNWNRLDTVTINKASGPINLPFNWESGFFYELGASRRLTGNWFASAGYCFTENSVPDQTYIPAVPDSDRKIYSLGIGYHGDRLSADFAWQYGDGGNRRVTGSTPSLIGATADGTYDNSLTGFSLSLALRF